MPLPSVPPTERRANAGTSRRATGTIRRLMVSAMLFGGAAVLLGRSLPTMTWWDARAAGIVFALTLATVLVVFGPTGTADAIRLATGHRRDAELIARLQRSDPRRFFQVVAVIAMLAGAIASIVATIELLTAIDDPATLGGAISSLLLGVLYAAGIALACVITSMTCATTTPRDAERQTPITGVVLVSALTVALAVAAITIAIAAIRG